MANRASVQNMRWALRLFSWPLVMTFGYIWTVGQGGLRTVNENLCDLWKDTFGHPPFPCRFNELILWLWGFLAVIAVLFIFYDLVGWFRRKRHGKRADRDHKDSKYMSAYEALHYIANDSCWGKRLRTVTSVIEDDSHKGAILKKNPIFDAFSEFSRGASESNIEVLGRKDGNGPPVHIPQTDWLVIGIDHNTLIRRQTSQTTQITASGTVPFYTDLKILREDVYRVWQRDKTRSHFSMLAWRKFITHD
jgi:hypothetical protein